MVTTNTLKQSTVNFKVFVLWLCNQRYYTREVIGIEILHRNLPYYEGIRAKTHRESRHEYKHHENKHENHASPPHTYL